MLLYPAIDLMGGQVVRLERGVATKKKVYSTDPVAIAKKWEAAGADWLHIVDLDAAFGGKNANLGVVQEIVAAVSIPCQLGGGMRDADSIRAGLATGAKRVIIGTRAAEPGFLAEAVGIFGSGNLAVGIDAKDGKVAVKGWVETMNLTAIELASEARNTGIQTIIYTDIATDGMLQGPNLDAMREMAASVPCELIASGGVSCPDDICQLVDVPGIHGVIIGRALYEGRMPENLRSILKT